MAILTIHNLNDRVVERLCATAAGSDFVSRVRLLYDVLGMAP